MITHFLTELDPRAKVKGSRDPLGLQLVWARLGRRVVGNLTTVTRSVPNFTTLLLGLYFADHLIESGRAPETERGALFLKFEQLAGYSRVALAPPGTRVAPLGVTRIRKRLDGMGKKLSLSARAEHQILSNQRTYGLWGLYSVAARQSGLLAPEESRPSLWARQFVEEHYLPRLSFGARGPGELLDLLARDVAPFELHGRHQRLADAVARILGSALSPKERELYAQSLVWDQPQGAKDSTRGLQRALWDSLVALHEASAPSAGEQFAWDQPFGYPELVATSEVAKSTGRLELAERLDDIRAVEPVLVAAADLYGFLLGHHDASLEHVVEGIAGAWPGGLKHLNVERFSRVGATLGSDLQSTVERLTALATALRADDPRRALNAAVEQNAAIMADRKGAAWTTIDDGELRVHLRVEAGRLTSPDELPAAWRNNYFINSLKTVGASVFGYVATDADSDQDGEDPS